MVSIRPASRRKQNTKIGASPYLFTAPYFLFYIAFFVFPTVYSLFVSLTDWDSLKGADNRTFVGIANYVRLFTKDKLFFKALGNTFTFMAIYIPILILGGLLIAVMLYKLSKGRRLFQTLNILPYITTPVAIGIIFSFLFDWSTGIVNNVLLRLHLVDEGLNFLGSPGSARFVVILLIVWKNFGYYMLIYLAGLATVPEDVNEAASIDGASAFQVFWHITMPLLKPITEFLILTSIISGFQLFDEPYLLFSSAKSVLGGPGRSCLTSMMYFFDQTFKSSTKLGYGASVSYSLFMFIMAASAIISLVLRRKERES